jgi:glycosyltransferase involved in cell wall biosynthesis
MSDICASLWNNKKSVLTLIMPVYDDANIVIPTITTLFFTIRYPFDLIIVYDRDDDKTIPVIQQLQKYFANILMVRNEWKHGVVNAIKTGIKNAKTPYIGVWICYQVDPFGIINEMVSKMEEGFDLIAASRFIYKGRFSRGSFLKRSLSKYANKTLHSIIGIPLTDSTSTIKIFRKDFLDSTPITTKVSGGWSLSLELTLKALVKGLKVFEVPLEKKNLNLMHGITRFQVWTQLPEYLRWLIWGFKNRKIIKRNYN